MKQVSAVPCAVILTALRVEYDAVRIHLSDLQEEIHPLGTVYESGLFCASNGQGWRIVLVETGVGNVGAAIEAERAMNYFLPQYIFLAGIAGGIKDVRIGDVVVATKVYSYESGKADSSFRMRPDMSIASHRMIQRANMEGRRKDWLRQLPKRYLQEDPRVFIGPIVAGEKVINSTSSPTWGFLRTNYEDALAVEMEGHGFLKAMYACQFLNALVIRGISDLIEGKSQADALNLQEVAANHAGAFVFGLLERLSYLRDNQQSAWVERESLLEFQRKQMAESSYPSPSFALHEHRMHWMRKTSPTCVDERIGSELGSIYLKCGLVALFDHNYLLARKQLAAAERVLLHQAYPEELAQVKYLQALVCLEEGHITSITHSILQEVFHLIEEAIALHHTYSYLYTLSLIRRAVSVSSEWSFVAEELNRQANLLPRTLKDEENIHLLKRTGIFCS